MKPEYKRQNAKNRFVEEPNPNIDEFIMKDFSEPTESKAFNEKPKEEYKREFYDYISSFYNNKRTINRYKCSINLFLNYCFEYNVDFIREPLKTLQKFLQNRKFNHKKKLSDNYINQLLFTLRGYYEYLYKMQGLIDRKDIIEIYKIRVNKFKPVRRQINITIEELAIIIQRAVSKSKLNEYRQKYFILRKMSIPKIRAFLYFAFFTGLRSIEILELQRKNIDLSSRILEVTWGAKTLKKRYIPIPVELCDILRDYFKIEPEVTSCFNITKTDMNNFVMFLKDIFPEKNIVIKDFRNSFATYMYYTCNIEISLLSQMMGHSNEEQTRAYLNKPNPKLYDEARKKIEEVVARNNDIKINKRQRKKNADR